MYHKYTFSIPVYFFDRPIIVRRQTLTDASNINRNHNSIHYKHTTQVRDMEFLIAIVFLSQMLFYVLSDHIKK